MKNRLLTSLAALAVILLIAGSAQAKSVQPIEDYYEIESIQQQDDTVMAESALPDHLRSDMIRAKMELNQDILDDQPYQPAPGDVVVTPVDPSSSTTVNDCHSGQTSDCRLLDVENNELYDLDCDCVADEIDNCPPTSMPYEDFYNPYQQDRDNDGVGDACTDTDGDGIMDDEDNCIDIENPGQEDNDGDDDGDLVGDACEDTDNDGLLDDEEDNCPYAANSHQEDFDNDGVGDACDNCVLVHNPTQRDTDNDNHGDACSNDEDGDGVVNSLDICPLTYDPNQHDYDGDGVGDYCDNCMYTFNPDQADSNSDGEGDACPGEASQEQEFMISTYGNGGGCSIIAAGTGTNLIASMILLAIALAPVMIGRRKNIKKLSNLL